ncbi:hypothetical protein J6590_040216 [Homalodisca vitripennis]|nr:hypothetical protein J6590_040216 [Homalodisca vitripennis]
MVTFFVYWGIQSGNMHISGKNLINPLRIVLFWRAGTSGRELIHGQRPHEQQWCATSYRSLLYTRKFSCEGIRSDGTWACWDIRDIGTITREQGYGVAGIMSES